MKLNLGCGQHLLPGYVNVDRYGCPDVRHDLEVFPWPWPDSSVDEFLFNHSLEHMGAGSTTFISIIKEVYRTGRDGASVRIVAPHPRHDTFLNDPTHVRPITPEVMSLFSRQNCAEWARRGCANSPLALQHDVDFQIASVRFGLDEPYRSALLNGEMTEDAVARIARERNNVITEIAMDLRIVKGGHLDTSRVPKRAEIPDLLAAHS